MVSGRSGPRAFPHSRLALSLSRTPATSYSPRPTAGWLAGVCPFAVVGRLAFRHLTSVVIWPISSSQIDIDVVALQSHARPSHPPATTGPGKEDD